MAGDPEPEQDHRTLALWAADCAERALPYFETVAPADRRPREAVDAVRSWARGGTLITEARAAAFAAHAAARDVDDQAATSAARAAGHAAATAHVVTHAPFAANDAAVAVTEGGGDAEAERAWQREHLAEHLRQRILPD